MRLPPLRPRQHGFTLIELIVTLTVLGVLAVVVVPSFNNAVLGHKLASFSNSFTASVQLARSEAIKRNASMKMCSSANGTSCAGGGGWQRGWIVFNDADNDGTVNGTETRVVYVQPIAEGFAFSGDVDTIIVRGTGLVETPANLTLCRYSPVGSQERTVTLGTTGRVAVAKTTTGSCSAP